MQAALGRHGASVPAQAPGAWRLLGAALLSLALLAWWWQAPTEAQPRCPETDSACMLLQQAWVDAGPVALTEATLQALPLAAAAPQQGPGALRLVLPLDRMAALTPAARTGPVPAEPPAAGLCLLRAPLVSGLALDGQRLPVPALQARRFMRPLHLSLGAWPAQARRLALEVQAPHGLLPGLGPVLLGEDDAMARVCGAQADLIQERMAGAVGVMALLAMAGLLLWWQLGERQAMWFALMAGAWVLHLLHLQSPAAPERWGHLYFASRAAFVPPMLMFALAFAGQPMQRWRLPLLLGCLGGLALLWLLPPPAWSLWLRTLAWAMLPLALVALGWLVAHLRHDRSLSALLMTLSFGLVILAQGLDIARWGSDAGYGGRVWSYVTVPLVCVAFALQVVERLVAHARAEARDAHRLRREVEAQRVRIAADYERLQRQREQLAVQEERRRIVRDMHDGLGAHLLSASAMLKSQPQMRPESVAELFDDALQELRSVLDVLTVDPGPGDPDDDPVAGLLGTLRWRMAPALQARGIELLWEVGALPAGFLPQDAARMHLLRLLQEACSNVLKHSGATQVRLVATTCPQGGVRMEVRDNGRGFEPGGTPGIGLDSMRARASTIGAAHQLRSAPGEGTSVLLLWPAPVAVAAAATAETTAPAASAA
ncbi:sensor histidine kinase [Ideonella livida]|uniref:Histidine kinase/HSP90-like ATPase domain-containing protein n=1 Tax=Ideonella livida TaxID=2707176 RepID=A0A7C9PK50_9BURK|nr:ATP-binding protein [Ideonella livida]NDY94036.1 hypothetical protein [Ideonella livida]